MGGVALTSLAVSGLFYNLFFSTEPWHNPEYLFLDGVDCPKPISIQNWDSLIATYNHSGLDDNPLDQYCLASIHKAGHGSNPSIKTAIELFLKAANKGLSLAVQELCRPSVYKDIDLNIFSKKEWEKIRVHCCPSSRERIMCPWYGSPQRLFQSTSHDEPSAKYPFDYRP